VTTVAPTLDLLSELVLDGRLSAVERIILVTLLLRQPTAAWCTAESDAELAARHGVSRRTVQAALQHGEEAGWVRRFAPDELRAWLAAAGRGAIFDALAAGVRSARRLIVSLHRLDELAGELAPRCEVDARAGAGARTTVRDAPPELAPACESLACAGVSNLSSNENENDNDHSRSRSETRAPATPPVAAPPDPEQVAAWERDRHLPGTLGAIARMALAALEDERQGRLAPPPAPARPEPPPAPAPPPAARQSDPPGRPPSAVRRLAYDLLEQLGEPDPIASSARDGLVVLLASEFGVPAGDVETLGFWERSLVRFGASEGGRIAVREILTATFRRTVRDRARWLSRCLAQEHRAWGAQKPTPGATRQSSPGVGRNVTPRALSNSTREVNP
jgi:hypothetical protein